MEGHASNILFTIFGIPVTSYITTMWAIMALLLGLGLLVTRRLQAVPGLLQNLVEFTVETLDHYFKGILGEEKGKHFFPILATLFLFILISNWSGLLPGAGHIKGFKPPTSTLSVTASLAIMVFVLTQVSGIRAKGWGYLKHFFQPVFFLFPLNVIEELVKPLSLSLRLFGNIFGGETIIGVLLGLAPYFGPVPMQLLEIFFGFIQALVFSTLAAIYISIATSEEH